MQNQIYSLVGLLRDRAERQPNAPAYTFLIDGRDLEETIPYAGLDRRARAIACGLLQRAHEGDRVALALPPGLDYIAALFGCLYAKMIAVPVYPPNPAWIRQSATRIIGIFNDATPALALTTERILPLVLERIKGPATRWQAIEELFTADADDWKQPAIDPDDIALLQYTSGSTSDPKGAILTHASILANSELSHRCIASTPESRLMGWLPPYHDLGLIGMILHPLYVGFPATLMSPMAFLRKPASWLHAMTRTRATISGAPAFAYLQCAKEIPAEQRLGLDLSHWKVAITGAEPISTASVQSFAEVFRPYGFSEKAFCPCYGLAESTLYVTGTPPGQGVTIKNGLVGCGRYLEGQDVRIVDPHTLREAKAGEIWVAGPSVARGYWQRSVETEQTFGATLPGADAGKKFLRTGDLGFFDGEELFVTGRIKELMIIRGRNYYPQDIEQTVVESHPALRRGGTIAFSVDVDGEERLVVVQEAEAEDPAPIFAAMRASIASSHELAVHAIVLVAPRSIPKTSSGKLMRAACKKTYLENALAPLAEWRAPVTISATQRFAGMKALEIEAWLSAELARRLNIPKSDVDPRQPLSRYALDSSQAVAMVGALEEHLGRKISPTVFWDHPTLASLAQFIADGVRVEVSGRRTETIEPIAIIGAGVRLPGARDLESLWSMLSEGRDAIVEVPPSRWDIAEYYDADPDAPGRMSTRWGGFLDGVENFDPAFFGISPREAERMDPQQRLLMEVTWEALENAGQSPERLAGSATGVFVGIGSLDYSQRIVKQPGARWKVDAWVGTGNAHSIAANRLSYAFDLRGPSVAVDTACSSSLVALHLACRSIWDGESELAIAGGVNLILSPEISISFSHARMLAPDGRCKSFDDAADGYVRSEGCGMMVLKPLARAVADGDHVHAVILGSAVNQDGRTPGITAPNPLAQEAVIRTALKQAGVAPEQVSYVEAHGTGTRLGDPIEVRALAAVYGNTAASAKCYVGSIKANVGHLETASGVAALGKILCAFQHGEIPPQINLKKLNPLLPIDGTRLVISRERAVWPRIGGRRFAGISSFGFGGTNSHVVLTEPPVLTPPPAETRPLHLATLSAPTPTGLITRARELARHLSEHPDLSIGDVSFTLNAGRAHFAERLALSVESTAELSRELDAFAAGRETTTGIFRGRAPMKNRPRPALLFSGQGAQYAGMGRRLYETQSVFKRAIDRCASVLAPLLEEPLLDVMYHDPARAHLLRETAYTQPALFALEWALYELWRSWGVEPAAVLGHSVGEFVAACAAEVFTLEEGLALIAERARLMQSMPRTGKMAMIFARAEDVASVLAPFEDRVAIAGVNGPEATVISGHGAPVEELLEVFKARGVRVVPLEVSHAFHSPMLDPMLDELERAAQKVSYRAPKIPLVSNVTGKFFAEGEIPDAAYYRRHARQPVLFQAGMLAFAERNIEVFLEVGPTPALIPMARHCVSGRAAWIPSLRQGQDDWRSVLAATAGLYVAGVVIDWAGFDREYVRRKRPLPTYPFERARHWWIDSFSSDESARRGHHPLLGRRLRSVLPAAQFEQAINTEALPALVDHQIQGSIVFPATAYLATALAALGESAVGLEEVNFQHPLFLTAGADHLLQTVAQPVSAGVAGFTISSSTMSNATDWTQHASGSIRAGTSSKEVVVRDIAAVRARLTEEITGARFYEDLLSRGHEYGPAYRGVVRVWRRDGEALGEIDGAPDPKITPFDPSILDACLQVSGQAVPHGSVHSEERYTYLPIGVASLRLYAPLTTPCFSHVVLADHTEDAVELSGDLFVYDQSGRLLIESTGWRLRRLGRGSDAQKTAQNWLHVIEWRPQPLASEAPATREQPHWVLFADRGGVAERLADELRATGATCTLVTPGDAYQHFGGDRYIVRPNDIDDLSRMFADRRGLRHVVFLWSLDLGSDGAATQKLGAGAVVPLVQSLVALEGETSRLSLITRGAQRAPAQATLWGLGRAIAHEHPELSCRRIDLDPARLANEVEQLARELATNDGEDELALLAGGRHVSRLVPFIVAPETTDSDPKLRVPASPSYFLESTAPGKFSGLTLRSAARAAPGPGQVEIKVAAAGVNFRDLMNAMGVYPGAPIPFGAECAGTISAIGPGVEDLKIGDEVMAIAPNTFAPYAIAYAPLVAKKPKGQTFEEAATIPITFLTAQYALDYLGRLRRGEKVLIHGAAGGVGLAAVQLAQRAGAEVYATAGSPDKRSFLQYLGVRHVFDSRTLDFAGEIMKRTGGAGVDVVLNSLPGEFIQASLSVLAAHGRFLEIGRTDIYLNRQIGLYPFRNNLSYFAIDLDRVCRERHEIIASMFRALVERFEKEELRPLPRRSWPIEEIVEAFRCLAQRKNTGKVVITIGSEAPPRSLLRADATYLVTGGLGGLGLALARWMVEKGARNIVLTGRNAPSPEQKAALAELETRGARVNAVRADVVDRQKLAQVFSEIRTTMPPLAGVIHAAGVLDDGLIVNLDEERLNRVLAPKIEGAWNLHELTQKLSLDFFVLFSSVAGVLGSPGQGNYAAANAFLDALAEHRKARGLPATAIAWGPWSEVGMAARTAAARARGVQLMNSISPRLGLELFEQLLAIDRAHVVVASADWAQVKKKLGNTPLLDALGGAAPVAAPAALGWNRSTLLALPSEERAPHLTSLLQRELARVMGQELERIQTGQTLNAMGIDSLMGLEIKETIETGLSVKIPMALMMEEITLAELAKKICRLIAPSEASQ